MNMRVNGQEMWYPIVSWGAQWYECNNQWEVLVEDMDSIELHVESLVQGSLRNELISLEKFRSEEHTSELQSPA